MKVEWTETASNKLSEIKSELYSEQETAEYKVQLILEIEKTILQTGCLFPSRNYKNRNYVKVKPNIISYKYYPNKEIYLIVAFQHQRQNKRY
ncbi:type II toxin-antitoxin system RelE/ParE family toxin [Lentibacillus sp. CBA3610]|nr:type II toxin-antitoxin system RelE/ParE family toxin [Lentibacillus sp. CBA3610]